MLRRKTDDDVRGIVRARADELRRATGTWNDLQIDECEIEDEQVAGPYDPTREWRDLEWRAFDDDRTVADFADGLAGRAFFSGGANSGGHVAYSSGHGGTLARERSGRR
jgi:hypothetical protein